MRTIPEGIRITKVGLWYIVLTLLVAIPAVNTGNNGLYFVEASLLAALVVSGVASRQNLRRLEIELSHPAECYAKQPFAIRYQIRNRGRLMSRRLLVVTGVAEGRPELVPYLDRGESRRGRMEVLVPQRGRFRIRYLHVASIFPLGLFRKGLRYQVDFEALVYPELLAAAGRQVRPTGPTGEIASRKVGLGHELFSLRAFRPGDDRRGIHWKQSARTGELIYLEREAEQGQRVTVELDNGVGELAGAEEEAQFERLVSEAATAACHYLERDFEVELVTRSGVVPFGRGRYQRRRILEHLALIGPSPRVAQPLACADPAAPRIRLKMAPVSA
ncbi:MAG: DUF58 domain-containing protein [Thermoanaerobaculia bacterium]